ncbi:DinB family protein [Streptomyces litchfieldiae]|uniref:DinB family protein n=1 Tax=Streptomyces litchfieldiae TaxID=3075543 RepID=A0ABU2MWM3_9ACTN|nr:DinB family protein [Streptomyces sp. DSM 44938]MDT0345479.1 DinB family protein [Streptomyces sp. DSM 44938]
MSDSRFELATTADERTLLLTFLDWHRETLLRKCSGLTDEQLRLRAVPTSGLTLMGLMRHLAGVERWYFQVIVAGEEPAELFTATDDDDEDFNDIGSATGEATVALWREQVEHSRRVVAEHPLDAVGFNPSRRKRQSLRWVLNHMIDEYARHNGHADLLREAIDGATGE